MTAEPTPLVERLLEARQDILADWFMLDAMQFTDLMAEAATALSLAQSRLAEVEKLLQECRKWQADGEYGDPLGPECWTPIYADFMSRLDEAIKRSSAPAASK